MCTIRTLERCFLIISLGLGELRKVQGQIRDAKVVINRGETEMENGMSYGAFSKVTQLSNIEIIGCFSEIRLTACINKKIKLKIRLKEDVRLAPLVRRTNNKLNVIRTNA